jgi:hypothetical protein
MLVVLLGLMVGVGSALPLTQAGGWIVSHEFQDCADACTEAGGFLTSQKLPDVSSSEAIFNQFGIFCQPSSPLAPNPCALRSICCCNPKGCSDVEVSLIRSLILFIRLVRASFCSFSFSSWARTHQHERWNANFFIDFQLFLFHFPFFPFFPSFFFNSRSISFFCVHRASTPMLCADQIANQVLVDLSCATVEIRLARVLLDFSVLPLVRMPSIAHLLLLVHPVILLLTVHLEDAHRFSRMARQISSLQSVDPMQTRDC